MKTGKAYAFLIVIAAFCWGISGIFTKTISEYGFTPMEMGFIKTFFALVILCIYFCAKDRSVFKLEKISDIKYFAVMSILGYSLYSVAYIFTVNEIGVGLGGAMLYTKLAFVLVFSKILLGQRITLKKFIVMSMVISGCVCLSGIFSSGPVAFTPKGLFWGLASGIGFSLYDVTGKNALSKYSSETVTLYTFMIATVFMAVFGGPVSALAKIGKTGTWGFMLIYAMVISVIPYMLYVRGLSKVEASTASIISTFELLVAAAAGVILYNEPLTLFKALGIALIIAAVCVMSINIDAKRVEAGEK